MKFNLIFCFLFFAQVIVAQDFIRSMQSSIFRKVEYGSADFIDIDNDDDLDLLMTGGDDTTSFAKLYRNDGLGNYTEIKRVPFPGVKFASIAYSDIDGDNDLDLYFSGEDNDGNEVTQLYANDGLGTFQSLAHSFEVLAMRNGAVFADVDNDGDQDLIIAGYSSVLNKGLTKLYINDGLGNFEENTNAPFEGVALGAIAVADVDGDNDQDIVISGVVNVTDLDIIDYDLNLLNKVSQLYINDGAGNFTKRSDTPFIGVAYASNRFIDIDNDGDQDLVIAGLVDGEIYPGSSNLYINDGAGNFKSSSNVFGYLAYPSIDFADIDGDGDQDAFVAGVDNFFFPNCVTEIFINNGSGIFNASGLSPIDCIYYGAAAFADIDGDGDQDLFLSGSTLDLDNPYFATLYENRSITTSVEFIADDLSFNVLEVYPNPASIDEVRLDFVGINKASVQVSVLDMNGRLLLQKYEETKVGSNSFTIDISPLVQGIYIVQLNDGENLRSQKLTVN